jgi:hypothetical protein
VFNYATNISATLAVQQLGVAGSERYAVQKLLQVHDALRYAMPAVASASERDSQCRLARIG